MAFAPEGNPNFDDLAAEHQAWLAPFDGQYLRNWEKLAKSDREDALIEAAIRRVLQSHGVVVEPNEDLTGTVQKPDFRCAVGDRMFCVEATCISTEKATEITGLADGANGAGRPTSLVEKIERICQKKAKQCSNQDVPVLVAIGTFHAVASMFSFSPPYPDMLLTGMTTQTVTIDRETLKAVGGVKLDSELESAAFLRWKDAQGIEFARSSISGLLLVGAAIKPAFVVGLLHPNPARRFDLACLPRINFREVKVLGESGQLRLQWSAGRAE